MYMVQRFARACRMTAGEDWEVAAGEAQDADAAFVRDFYRTLRRFAAVVGWPVIEPDDLVQEALERALRLGPLQDLDDPLSYLRRAMVNLASNARRSSGRRQRAFARLSRAAEPAPASYPSDLAILRAVSTNERTVLYLADVEQWSYAEIATLLGCSEGAARTRAARGRRALRAALEAVDD
jgi:DNA-directed RNA polymerase specialized sigma24 family protein